MAGNHGALCVAALLLAAPALAQEVPEAQPSSGPVRDTIREGGKIATQPAQDVGVVKPEIPPVLLDALDSPYDLDGTKSCTQLSVSISALDGALGPDFDVRRRKKESKVAKLAEQGGKSVVNAFIPFRGLVREVSGAAPAQRRLNAAIDAGYARRGFLRGLQLARRCKPR